MPLGPNDPRFQVNDQVFIGFEAHDTRHRVQPEGLTSARVLRLPGRTTAFAIKGQHRPAPLIVEGILQAANEDALYALIDQHNAWLSTAGIVKVTLHATDYENCTPMLFEITGPVQNYSEDNGDTVKAEAPARFRFERLQS
ncbi:MAG: hypothetical protein AAF085_10820 [Planctomycetota bacterium]